MEKSSHIHPTALPADDPRLQRFSLFSGLGPRELSALLKLTDTEECAAGQRIVSIGEPGLCLYVLLEGSALVSVGPDDAPVELARMEGGDFFGEVALVDDGPRSANVTALTPCSLLRITRMTIGVLGGTHPEAAIQILSAIGSALVARLRTSNQKYLDVLSSREDAH